MSARNMKLRVVGAIALGIAAISGIAGASSINRAVDPAQPFTGVDRAAKTAQPLPAFTGLDSAAEQEISSAIRSALDEAGADRRANAKQIDFDSGFSVAVVRTEGDYYLALHNSTSQRTTTTAAPIGSVKDHAGSWVLAGGAGGATMALLVPDGVADVTVTTGSGAEASVPAVNNVALVREQVPFTASFEHAGKSHRAVAGGIATPAPAP